MQEQKNNIIFNLADENEANIDIFGAIGSSLFNEGITKELINEKLNSISAPVINLNISSLGGNVEDALVIYDILRKKPAKIKANLMGFVASAGTIIAMAGDTIEMSQNSQFLVHQVHTMVDGNSADLREAANELDKIDEILLNIYQKKTGKNKLSVKSLMKEDRWLSAQEAKDFGFIDNVIKDYQNSISNEIIDKINNSNLPKIKIENKMENLKDKVLAAIGFKNDEVIIAENTELKSQLHNLTTSKTELGVNAKAEKTFLENSILEKDIELENKVKEVAELQAKVEEMQTEINKMQAVGIENNGNDPSFEQTEITEEDKIVLQNIKALKTIQEKYK